jgi:hypothetical protein
VGARRISDFESSRPSSIQITPKLGGLAKGSPPIWCRTARGRFAAYADLDEWHQSFVPLRHDTLRDVGIEAIGALLAQSKVWWVGDSKTAFHTAAVNPSRNADKQATKLFSPILPRLRN